MKSRRTSRSCACGCGDSPIGREFCPGHDAKLRSKFLKRIDDGDEKAIDEFLENWPRLAYPYGYDRPKLLARLGRREKGRGWSYQSNKCVQSPPATLSVP